MPVINSTNQYKIIHDHNIPLCFVGNTHYSKILSEYFNSTRNCDTLTLEEIETKSAIWRDSRQFICLSTNPAFKLAAQETFRELNLKTFSVMANMASIGNNVTIGYNVMIDQFTYIWDNCVIGDFNTLACHVTIAHGSSVGDCCHIAPYAHLAYATVGDGVYIGNGAFVFANMDNPISVTNWVNIQAFSRVLHSIDRAGTYYSNRLVDTQNSLELRL